MVQTVALTIWTPGTGFSDTGDYKCLEQTGQPSYMIVSFLFPGRWTVSKRKAIYRWKLPLDFERNIVLTFTIFKTTTAKHQTSKPTIVFDFHSKWNQKELWDIRDQHLQFPLHVLENTIPYHSAGWLVRKVKPSVRKLENGADHQRRPNKKGFSSGFPWDGKESGLACVLRFFLRGGGGWVGGRFFWLFDE